MKRQFTLMVSVALTFLLLAGTVWAGGGQEEQPEEEAATGARTGQYGESPMLAEMVQAGELPPVEERLPAEPLVVEVVDEIGVYGGTWRRWNDHPRIFAWEPLAKMDIDGNLFPNLATSWEVSDDKREFTFNLRRGVKWSDGVEWSSEDIMFLWNDIYKNEDYAGRSPGGIGAGAEITAPDRYTIVISFPDPQPGFMAKQSIQWGGLGFEFASWPKHYLSRFHPDYAASEDLNALIEEAGMDTWMQLMEARWPVESNPEVPVLIPWKTVTRPSEATQRAERNPYYWKVDAEGNQLPYIDYATWPQNPEKELGILKLAAGEIDLTTEGFSAEDMPTLFEYANQGDYQVERVSFEYSPSTVALYINQNYQRDEEMAEILRNVKFRRALSVAINRDEFNEFVALGQGTPHQATVPATHFAGSPELATYMIDHDPQTANSLLDEMGLDNRDNEGFRTKPSGEKLTLVLSPRVNVQAAEIIKEYFEDVGIRTSVSAEEMTFWFQNKNNGLHMISQYSLSNGNPELRDTWWIPITLNCYWAPLNGSWVASNGTSGIEPEGTIAEIIDEYQQFLVETNESRRRELLTSVVDTVTRNLYMIGTVTKPPQPMPVSNRMHNVPDDMVNYATRMEVWEYCQLYIQE